MNRMRTSPLTYLQDRLAALSLRTKLIAANAVITLLALAGMGYYVFYRAVQSNAYQSTQLDNSVQQQAQDRLTGTTAQQAVTLDGFFSSTRDTTASIGSTTNELVSEETRFLKSWDAAATLSRLANGSWDNSNSETGSVFLPARLELTDNLAIELNALKQLDLVVPTVLKQNPDVIAVYFGGTAGETLYYPNIDLAAIVPADFDVTQRPWFVNAAPAQNPARKVVWSEPYLDAALHGYVITNSTPVFDDTGNFRGVVAMDIQLNRMTALVSQIQIGSTGFAFLLDPKGQIIAMPEGGYKVFGVPAESVTPGAPLGESALRVVSMDLYEVLIKMTTGQTGIRTIAIGGSDYFIAYRPLPAVRYSLGLVVPIGEMLTQSIAARTQIARDLQNTLVNSLFLTVGILVLSLLATLAMGNALTSPLRALTRVAEQFTAGDLNVQAKAATRDEIGTLALTLNSMSATIRKSFETLEARILDRTKDLERRAVQMRAAAEVGNAATSIRDLNSLLDQAARLISLRFGFYHCGIFLLDAEGRYAILRSTSSEGGITMLQRGHKLQVGVEGIVGTVAGSGRSRIAQDTGQDAVFFDNPDLPETHSEIAVPISAGGEILGVLDVQSTIPAAFTEEDAATLQIVADQLANAIENVRLLEESRAATESTRRAYGEISVQSWKRRLEETIIGYRSLERGGPVALVRGDHNLQAQVEGQDNKPVLSGDARTLHVPILVRNQAIGALRLTKPNRASWTENEIQTAQTLSDQLSGALDSARLYDEAQKRAQRETSIAQVSARISRAVEVDDILRATAEELGKMMGDSEVVVQLNQDAQ